MDDMYLRQRYSRNRPSRAKKRNTADGFDFKTKLRVQILFCIIILLLSAGVKNMNTPMANKVSSTIKQTISYDIDVTGFLKKVDSTLRTVSGKPDSDFSQPAVETNANPDTKDDVDKKIDYSTVSDKEENTTTSEPAVSAEQSPEDSASPETVPQKNTSDSKIGFLEVPVYGTISSGFGERVHPIKKSNEFHKGIDIAAKMGEPVKAALDGEVTEAAFEKTYGNYIKISHQDGMATVYAHCLSLSVKKGVKVKKGDKIAKVGSTGDADGPHLHFEVWKDGEAQNPLDYISLPVKSDINSKN